MTLSDKIEGQMKTIGKSIPTKDAKEFIKEEKVLLDLLYDKKISWAEFNIRRNQLAGKDLI